MRIILCLFTIIFSVLVTGCATATKYGPVNENGGYSDRVVAENLYVVRFSANAYTASEDVRFYSELRAIEVCRENGKKFARILEQKDDSKQRTVQRSSTNKYNAPSNFNGTVQTNANGTVNSYGNNVNYGSNTNTNVNGTYQEGAENTQSTSWNEVEHYPAFDTLFLCTNKLYRAKIALKPLKKEELGEKVPDMLGAMLVGSLEAGSPNKGMLHAGDIILKIDGERVADAVQFSQAIDTANNPTQLSMSILREGKVITVQAKTVDTTPTLEAQTRTLISIACKIEAVKGREICSSRKR